MLDGNLRLGDQRDFFIAQLAGTNNPAIPALQPLLFLGRQNHQPVMPVLGNCHRLRQRLVGQPPVIFDKFRRSDFHRDHPYMRKLYYTYNSKFSSPTFRDLDGTILANNEAMRPWPTCPIRCRFVPMVVIQRRDRRA
ncbi:MAG: hypothetical protein P4M00_23150 [Azospirillaceae bacterium]|nr:hypothetical protein [Azospirillaceae bacterium]